MAETNDVFVGSAVIEGWSAGGSTLLDPGGTDAVQCRPPSVDFKTSGSNEERAFPETAIPYRIPSGAKESHTSPAIKNCPPAHVVSGTGTRCHVWPPSKEAAATRFWKGPWIHAATMLSGRTGFTATKGPSASSIGQTPLANPSLHVPTALGRESSTGEPLTARAADASGVDGAVGSFRSTQPTSKAAPSRRHEPIPSRCMDTSLRGQTAQSFSANATKLARHRSPSSSRRLRGPTRPQHASCRPPTGRPDVS